MKTKFHLPFIATLIILSFTSCKKERHGRHGSDNAPPATINLDVSVKAGDMYRLNLNPYGNGAASITKQAAAYTISQISTDVSGNNIYQYSSSLDPKAGNNTDQVVLKINALHESGGGCHNHEDSDSSPEKNITINFTVN